MTNHLSEFLSCVDWMYPCPALEKGSSAIYKGFISFHSLASFPPVVLDNQRHFAVEIHWGKGNDQLSVSISQGLGGALNRSNDILYIDHTMIKEVKNKPSHQRNQWEMKRTSTPPSDEGNGSELGDYSSGNNITPFQVGSHYLIIEFEGGNSIELFDPLVSFTVKDCCEQIQEFLDKKKKEFENPMVREKNHLVNEKRGVEEIIKQDQLFHSLLKKRKKRTITIDNVMESYKKSKISKETVASMKNNLVTEKLSLSTKQDDLFQTIFLRKSSQPVTQKVKIEEQLRILEELDSNQFKEDLILETVHATKL